MDAGHNTSSWGGAVLKGPDGTYHMWAAEMTEHCGIGTFVFEYYNGLWPVFAALHGCGLVAAKGADRLHDSSIHVP